MSASKKKRFLPYVSSGAIVQAVAGCQQTSSSVQHLISFPLRILSFLDEVDSFRTCGDRDDDLADERGGKIVEVDIAHIIVKVKMEFNVDMSSQGSKFDEVGR